MLIKRFSEALQYEAPNHFDCKAMRLAGFEEGGPEKFWVGCSHFLPGGGAGPDSSPMEKVYVILSGELTIRVGGTEEKAGPMDSVTIPAGEVREIVNEANDVVTMIVAMPYPEKS
ncbi:cupin domain-containing protein [Parasedimentitalea marina]|uniref:Cupin domain-containing protein n=1 Tax=Parasedimentitalea marina TaxID=2483033 RepID=A0A3T0N5K9_9RHOB|nr:cupin domain-containing protein [Parasedimentitalea marina]AZV79320.1 cupin domain-containing protein [Parasedimentitalea marina]